MLARFVESGGTVASRSPSKLGAMEPSAFIDLAIERGEANGLRSLDPVEAVVFAISEAEVYCDMDGIDALLRRYGAENFGLFASSFLAVGAGVIAEALHAIAASNSPAPEQLLAAASDLITSRCGYSYESIELFVARAI